jgi:hypothetical protein
VYKPPKQVPGIPVTTPSSSGLTPDLSNAPPPRLVPDATPTVSHPVRPDLHQPASEGASQPTLADLAPDNVTDQPRIEVVDLTGAGQATPPYPADLVIVGAENTGDRTPLADSGLFMDANQALYADVAGIGVAGIQTNAHGQFVLSSESPHQDLLVLMPVEGKSQWKKRSDASPPADTGWEVPDSSQQPVMALKRLLLSRLQASFLTEPDATGTSWSVRGEPSRKYVRLKDGNSVMVAFRENGDVQAVSANHPNSNGPLLERVPGTSHWQVKPQARTTHKRKQAAPQTWLNKRGRIEQPSESAVRAQSSTDQTAVNRDLWRTWGETSPIPSGSIPIGNLHYRTLPGATQEVAIIRPFSFADGFDGFEGMLIAQPWRQPVRAVSSPTTPAFNSTEMPGTQWTVSGPLFDKTLTQSIADSFPDFSAVTARTLARSLFEQTNPSNTLTSPGLLHMSEILVRWQGKGTEGPHASAGSSRSAFTDPLQLLPITATENQQGIRTLHLPAVDHHATAQRIDFALRIDDLKIFQKGQPNLRVRHMFQTLLARCGYEVFPPASQQTGGTLVFKRAEQTYFLTIRNTTTRVVQYDLPDRFKLSTMRTYLGHETFQALNSALANGSVMWLVGGFHLTETRQADFFMYRVSPPESATSTTPARPAQTPQIMTGPDPVEPTIRPAVSSAHREIAIEAAQPHAIDIEGVRHTLLPRAVDDRIVYLDDPDYPASSFDQLETLLRTQPQHQPRGAIRVPPQNAWMIDTRMPFEKSLVAHIAEQFPVLSTSTLQNVAKRQFILANGSETTTGAGLTTLRQTFNDWRMGNAAPRPELVDPLLMLATTPITPATRDTVRKLVLPLDTPEGELHRIDMEINYFRLEFDYLLLHPGGQNHKTFMTGLLIRNGYDVLPRTEGGAWPALVFTHPNHDRVFFLSLYRIQGNRIPLPDRPNPAVSSTLLDRIGPVASQRLLEADAAGRVIWLKGGIQRWKSQQVETAFIIRDDIPMI